MFNQAFLCFAVHECLDTTGEGVDSFHKVSKLGEEGIRPSNESVNLNPGERSNLGHILSLYCHHFTLAPNLD